jgi:hypothetical protein
MPPLPLFRAAAAFRFLNDRYGFKDLLKPPEYDLKGRSQAAQAS